MCQNAKHERGYSQEYVVHPQLHPEKRVKEWTDLIEGTNGKELPADQSRASAYMNRGSPLSPTLYQTAPLTCAIGCQPFTGLQALPTWT